MTRCRKNDARITEILAAFDRQATSPARTDATLCMFMSSVAATVIDRFQVPGGWTDARIRAVLVAFLLNAPIADLDDMRYRAREETTWIEQWEREAAGERAA